MAFAAVSQELIPGIIPQEWFNSGE